MTLTTDRSEDLFDRHRVIDVDTHLTEPPDVWTARVPATHARPRARTSSASTARTSGWPAASASARPATTRWPASTASCRVDPEDLRRHRRRRCTTPTRASRSSTARASTPRCCTRTSAASATATSCASATASSSPQCVRAYNDFLTDWCSADPDRLLAVHRAAVLGRRLRGRRAPALRRQRPPGGELLQPAAGLRRSRRWPTRTGTRSGRPPRRPASRSASTSVAASMGTQFVDTAEHGLDDELRQGLVADLHGQHALHRPT